MLIAPDKLNDINPQAWLADVLACIAHHPASRVHELLPWRWMAIQYKPPPHNYRSPRCAADAYGSATGLRESSMT